MTHTHEHAHIEAEDLAAYLDGGLPEARRSEVETHLAGCSACRAELVDVTEVVAGHAGTDLDSDEEGEPTPSTTTVGGGAPSVGVAGGRRWTPWLAGAGGLAAAAAAAMILLSPGTPQDGAAPDRLRSGPQITDEIVRLTPLNAEADVTDAGVVLTLSWEPASGELTYRVSVTDAAGELLASAETTESSLTLDGIESASSGDLLFWYVDATLANGESASTGVQSVTVP